jgi:hypothetical protein
MMRGAGIAAQPASGRGIICHLPQLPDLLLARAPVAIGAAIAFAPQSYAAAGFLDFHCGKFFYELVQTQQTAVSNNLGPVK